jgi:hypothetical protein
VYLTIESAALHAGVSAKTLRREIDAVLTQIGCGNFGDLTERFLHRKA